MSNQSFNGFEGSQPFMKDEDYYKTLTTDELKSIIKKKKKELRKNYKELTEKKELIRYVKRITKLNKQVLKGVDIKNLKKKKKKKKKLKTFEDYFKECIKNKEIPKDTPDYLRKALERALYEHEQGIEIEKSALDRFAIKYIFKGIPGITPAEFFDRSFTTLEGVLKENRNIKFRMVFICLFERFADKEGTKLEQYEAYFSTSNYKNLQSTNVEKILKKGFDKILKDIDVFNKDSSGWYFSECLRLELHTVKYNPIRGSSYIDLPEWIKIKKQLLILKIEMTNALFGVFLDIFIQKKKMLNI